MNENNSNNKPQSLPIIKPSVHWVNKQWRPMMGWVYMATCVADFILFPILWNIVQAITHAPVSQWQPITLQANGFYHLTMCAVLGISAYGRTQEKLAGVENDPIKVTNGAEPVQSDSSTGNPE